ncbi:hypothetical protein EV121DRAFT_277064 [Schizophyllum commune]
MAASDFAAAHVLADEYLRFVQALQDPIRYYYTLRGTKFKCRSPLDFTSDHDGMLVGRNIPTNPEERAAAARAAVDDLRASLQRLVQASPTLAALSPAAQKALVDEFCSERTVHMEAQTHHRHPYSPTTSNSAISLYTLIYALARETHGERTLDSWVKNNLEPAMRGVSYVLQSRDVPMSSFEAAENQPTVATEPYVAPSPVVLEEAASFAPTSTGGAAQEATALDPVSTATGSSTSSQVVYVPAESTSSLPDEMPAKKRKNDEQPETSSQASKKAKTAVGGLKRATSMVCRIPVPRKSFASDKGKEVAAPPNDDEPAAPKLKGSRTAAFFRKPFGPQPPLPQWK